MKYAIFDYDNTLSEGYSKYELGYLLEEEGLIKKGFRSDVDTLEGEYHKGAFDYNEKFIKDKKIFADYFAGLKRTDVSRFIVDNFDFKKFIYPWSEELIKQLHEKGFWVVVITGCWDFIIEEAQVILDFDTFFASQFELEQGKLTKEFFQIMDNETKEAITQDILIDSELSIGIGDSIADFEILKQVDHPFLISNNDEAVKMAEGKDYTVVTHENAMDEILKVVA